MYHRLVQAVAAVPGVEHAGGSLNPPIAGGLVGDIVVTDPGVRPRPDAEVVSQFMDVTPGALAVYGTPIRSGRDIDERDTADVPRVMLVDEALVRRFFPGRNMLGAPVALTYRRSRRRLSARHLDGGRHAGDAAYRSIRTPMQPTIYCRAGPAPRPASPDYFFIARAIGERLRRRC